MKTLAAVALISLLSAGYANAHGLTDRIDEARSYPHKTVTTPSSEELCEQANVVEQRPTVSSTHEQQYSQKLAMHSPQQRHPNDIK